MIALDPPIPGREASFWQMRRARKEARGLARAARRALARTRQPVARDAHDALEAAIAAVESATARKDHDATCESMVKLEELVERHLPLGKKSTFREYFDSIGVAVIVALLLRAFVIEAFKIPSGSMIPTMQVGDHIFVNKFIYGLRIPFTKIRFFDWRKPHRGEVIVFIYPEDPSKDFIKRVIAVGGDTVEVRKSVVYVNGKPAGRSRLPGLYTYDDYDEHSDIWSKREAVRVRETLGDDTYITMHDPNLYPGAHCAPPPKSWACNGPYVVPKGYLFVMGDNRDNSHDSRYWGPLPVENVKGKAIVVWWSSMGGLTGIRWNRLGHIVQ